MAAPTRETVPSRPSRGRDAQDGPRAVGPVRLLWQAAAASRTGTGVLLLLELAESAVALTLPAVLGHTLDRLLAGERPVTLFALCGALIAAEMLLAAAGALLTGVLGARGTAWLRRRTFTHLLAVGPRGAARFTPGDLVTRLGANATDAGTAPAAGAAAVATLVTPVGGLIALAVVDLWLAAVFLAGVPLLVLLLRAFARSSSESVGRYQETQGRIAATLVEALGGAATVAAAGTVGREQARVLRPLAELGVHGRRMWHVYGRAMVGSGILAPLLTTAVLATGGLRLAADAVSVGDLLAATRYCVLAAGIGAFAGRLDALVRGRAAATRLTDVLAVPAVPHGTRRLPPTPGERPEQGRVPGRLELRDVAVTRDGRTVLDGVDLVVPGGTTMAVVGRSGSGKSLLAAVAGRLEDPERGEVLLDGVPLRDLGADELRGEVGYAFERPALFGTTVGDAVGFGPHPPPRDEVTAAARAAGADGFVRRLPDGYDTAVAAAPLSGGELQRLGLARAFAHAGRLLVLDDATSSLDSVTEMQVGRALAHEVRPGTRLLVAHRVSSAARADAVAWLDAGRIRVVGRHADLWHDPAYRAVFAADGPSGAAPVDNDPADTAPRKTGPAETGPAETETSAPASTKTPGTPAEPGPAGQSGEAR